MPEKAAATAPAPSAAYDKGDKAALLRPAGARTSSDITRKRGSGRGSEDSQEADYVNDQLNRVLYALDAFKKGDVSVRLTKQNDDIFAEIAEAYNSMVEMIGGVGGEVSRIDRKSVV